MNYPAKYARASRYHGGPISANDIIAPTRTSIRDNSTGVEGALANPPSYDAISDRVQP